MIKNTFLSIAVAAMFFVSVRSAYLVSYFNEKDKEAIRSVFSTAASNPPDVATAFYGAGGLTLLHDKLPDTQKLCTLAKKHESETDIELLFHASALASLLENCKLTAPKAQEILVGAISPEKTTHDIYHSAAALKYLGVPLDQAKLSAALAGSLKKDDSATSLGYAFHAATFLNGPAVGPFFDRIEDCVAQADEIDGKYLQFDGGLSVSAVAISGIYELAEKMNKTPNVKADEAVKLTNFLLSRKGVPLARPAYHLLRTLKAFTTDKYHIPVAFSLASPVALSPSQKTVRVKVCNVMGETVGPLVVSVDKATHVSTSGVVMSKTKLTPVANDNTKTLFELNFLETPRAKGFYVLTLSAASPTDKRLVGTQGAEITVKVTTEIGLENVEISVADREQSGPATTVHKVASFSKLGTVLDADVHQKVAMKFGVKDKSTNELTRIHQAFVIFTHSQTGQEIIFIAEPDSTKNYKFDVDLQKSIKDFDYLSGKYAIKLILGDSVISNAVNWHLADINLHFPSRPAPQSDSVPVGKVIYQKRPEIEHMFRTPEKRPPQFVSDAFTGLVLLPVLILLILWIRIGVNVNNFPFSLYALGFHIGLTAICGLYLLFWLKLNMFQTLKYLAVLGAVTYFCGNRMLRGMADKKKPKIE